jgi:MerR family redox-sensitive transcriptional activator SoxR
MIAQKLGLPLSDIAQHMKDLPIHKAPSKSDWTRISKAMRSDLNDRIAQLERLRDSLDGCIGCGCLSLESCALYNPGDRLGSVGSGPQILMG